MRLAALVLAFAALLSVLGVTGCRGCSDATLARLESKQGDVDRDTKATMRQWSQAAVGAEFSLGDAVRTGDKSTAVLDLDDGSRLEVRPKTVLRFSDTPPAPGQQGFDIETGEAVLATGDSGLSLQTSLGIARIQGNSRVLLRRTTRGVRFEVQVGRAVLETNDGKQNPLAEGEGIVVGVGEAVIERISNDAGVPPAPPKPVASAGESTAEVADVTGDVSGQVSGSGVSLKAPDASAFTALAPGAVSVRAGSTVKVRKGSSLNLQRGGASALLEGTGTYVVGGAGGALVEVQQGSLALSGGRTRVVVPGGVIVTTPGASATVDTLGAKGTRVRVSKDQVSVQGAAGSEQVHAGQEATLGTDGAVAVEGRGLGYADISMQSGESVVVHDPKPPTAVRILFGGACPEGGVIRVKSKAGNQSASGSGSAALPFKPGQHDYALHCLEGGSVAAAPASQGKLTILLDAGTRPVPKTPPATALEADGRNYTVMYQNQLPSVSLRWSKAPQAARYVLSHHSPQGQKSYTVASPAYSFRSGALLEGSHSFYFEAAGRVSRQTTVNIRFDNAAPTASLQTPAGLDVKQGEAVTISGMAQPGWSVQINGENASLDAQQRFSQKAEMPTNERALAVKLTHPQRGTHIYVRRAAGVQ